MPHPACSGRPEIAARAIWPAQSAWGLGRVAEGHRDQQRQEDGMGHEHHHHRRARSSGESDPAGGEKRALRMRATLESGQVADHLTTLAQALRAGGVTLRSGGQTVMLQAAETVELEVHAGEEGHQSVVRLGLRWQTPAPPAHLEITPGVQSPAPEPPDPTTQAHGAGLVLPGDPASPPRSGRAAGERKGAAEQQA